MTYVLCLWTAATNGPIVNFPYICVCRATVERYWPKKAEELGEKRVTVPLCQPQIPYGLTRVLTRSFAARGRGVTAWTLAWPVIFSNSWIWTQSLIWNESVVCRISLHSVIECLHFLRVGLRSRLMFLKVSAVADHFTGGRRSRGRPSQNSPHPKLHANE
jgi:hypothetical protein